MDFLINCDLRSISWLLSSYLLNRKEDTYWCPGTGVVCRTRHRMFERMLRQQPIRRGTLLTPPSRFFSSCQSIETHTALTLCLWTRSDWWCCLGNKRNSLDGNMELRLTSNTGSGLVSAEIETHCAVWCIWFDFFFNAPMFIPTIWMEISGHYWHSVT